ncbi:hypothetical protein D3C87_12480 [compost metagenome]
MLQKTLILVLLLFFKLSFGQQVYNDLFFEGLKGKVKTITTTLEYADTSDFHMDNHKRVVSYYKENGNRSYEEEYLDTSIVQKRIFIYMDFKGFDKRIKTITTYSVTPLNKRISNYYHDNSGFDTLIAVCDEDSSYYQLYRYQKNQFGLRSKGVEFNGKNGNLNGSFEIHYLNENIIDSINYINRFDKIVYTEFYIYSSTGDVTQIYYSDGGCHLYESTKIDEIGNWLERKSFYVNKESVPKLVSTQRRYIEYYLK